MAGSALVDFFQRLLALLSALAPAGLVGVLLLAISIDSLRGRVVALALGMGPFAGFSSLVGLIEKPLAALLTVRLPTAFEEAFLRAALPEETAKILILTTIVLRHEDAEPRRDGILAGAWLGLGFGLLENFFYVTEAHHWLTVAAMRAVLSVPFHVGLGMVMGLYVSRATLNKRAFVYALAIPLLLHGFFDWGVLEMQWAADGYNAENIFFGAVLVAALAALRWLLINPVATDLRAIRRTAPLPSSRSALFRWAARIAILLRIIGVLIFLLCLISFLAAFVRDWRLALFAVLGLMPLTFAALWRSITAETVGRRSSTSASSAKPV
jgi:RsiW-degrading membrane proteinase PrsW (M82 family)